MKSTFKLMIVGLLLSLCQISIAQINNSSIIFDGVDDYVACPNNSSLNPLNTITVEAWIKANSWGTNYWDNTIVGKDYWDGTIRGYSLRCGDNGSLSFVIASGSNWNEAVSGPILMLNTWYFVTGTYDGTELRLYVNDSLVATQGFVGSINVSNDSLNIGKCPSPVVTSPRMFDGRIDQVEIWNVTLDANQINQYMMCSPLGNEPGLAGFWNFEEGVGTMTGDLTSNNSDGVLRSGAQWSLDAKPLCVPTCATSYDTINTTSCGVYTSPSGLQTFSVSGTYNDTIPNAGGCDSVLTINLIVYNAVTNFASQTICSGTSYAFGTQTLSSPGTYTEIFQTLNGCDSIVNLNLTVNVIDVSTIVFGDTITANNNSASYQWLDCNNGYSYIPGQTAQTFVANSNGSYAVLITENTCLDTSACLSITTIGIIESSMQSDFIIFPNPSNGIININAKSKILSIQIYDNMGNLMEEVKPNINRVTHKLSKSDNGFIYVYVKDEQGAYSKKIIIN